MTVFFHAKLSKFAEQQYFLHFSLNLKRLFFVISTVLYGKVYKKDEL